MQRTWVWVAVVVSMSACGFDVSGLPGLLSDGGAPPLDAASDATVDALPPPPPPPPPPTHAEVWLTTPDRDRLLAREPDLTFAAADPALPTITIDPGQVFQVIEGVGASLTDSSAWLIANRLPGTQRQALLRRLFDPVAGIGLRVLRQPMGASDFALAHYSYDDTPPDLADFSIEHDRAYLVPVLQEIRAINPELLLLASPWSPPGWMKTTSSLIGGRLRPQAHGALADYFVRFAEAYAAEGLPIAAFTVQNEPHYEPSGYPGMFMEWDEQSRFIVDALVPALRHRGLTPRILVWDHNWDEPDYAAQILGEPAAREVVAGTAFHCYYGDPAAQSMVHALDPEREIWLTECSDGEWRGGFAASLRYDVEVLLITGLRHWARSVITWNLALDKDHGPRSGGCPDCLGVVEIAGEEGEVTPNADFYALGHVGRFVAPGARRIASTELADGVQSVAFRNPDGGVVVLLLGPEDRSATVQVAISGVAAPFTLPPGGVATLRWQGQVATLDHVGWVAAASSTDGRDVASAAIDGDPATRWTTGQDQDGDEWFALDLGASRTFSAITLDAGDSAGDQPRHYEVEVSDDGKLWTPVVSGDGPCELFTIRFAPVTARHVQLRQTGRSDKWWSIHELQLHR